MNTYDVTVTYHSGIIERFGNIKAYNQRDAKNLVIAELWDTNHCKSEVRSIRVELIL